MLFTTELLRNAHLHAVKPSLLSLFNKTKTRYCAIHQAAQNRYSYTAMMCSRADNTMLVWRHYTLIINIVKLWCYYTVKSLHCNVKHCEVITLQCQTLWSHYIVMSNTVKSLHCDVKHYQVITLWCKTLSSHYTAMSKTVKSLHCNVKHCQVIKLQCQILWSNYTVKSNSKKSLLEHATRAVRWFNI